MATIGQGLSPEDKATTKYIQYLMQGSGADVDYEQIRQELDQQSMRSRSDLDHTINSTPNTTNTLDQFNTFSKLADDSNISNIAQSNFKSNTGSEINRPARLNTSRSPRRDSSRSPSPRRSTRRSSMSLDELRQKIEEISLLKRTSDDPASAKTISLSSRDRASTRTVTSKRAEGISPFLDQASSHITKPASRAPQPHLQLAHISKQLVKSGFSPLHASLMFTSDDVRHIAGSLSDTQALHLISTISILINEYDRKTSDLELVLQKNHIEVENEDLKERLAQLEIRNDEMMQKKMSQDDLIDKLKFELDSMFEKQQLIHSQNAKIVESMRKQYYINESSLEPAIYKIVSAYESKIDRLKETKSNQSQAYQYSHTSSPITTFEGFSQQSDTAYEIRHRAELNKLRIDLKRVQDERDVLQIQCINQSKTWKRAPQSIIDTQGLTTRDLIHRDKQHWHAKAGHLSGYNQEELQSLVKDICVRFGITDLQNISPCLEKIQTVVALIPQMEQFIRQINAIVLAYETNHTSSPPSSVPKLERSVEVIRDWAEIVATSRDSQLFIRQVHDILGLSESSGSLQKCLALMSIKVDEPVGKNEVHVDIAQEEIAHFRNLFELRDDYDAITRMNDLFVFCAEVDDGLSRLKKSLGIEENAQAGRVLIKAADTIENYHRSPRG